MKIYANKDLTEYNTFGIRSIADRFSEIRTVSDLTAIDWNGDLFILGGGSNILLPERISAHVLHMAVDHIRADETMGNEVLIEVGAGVDWHRLVTVCVEMGWGGIENLALIPGQVGAAPVQNIGAYGVELADVFISLRAWDRTEGQLVELSKAACGFGYRNSIFKSTEKDRYVITSVTLKLQTGDHDPNISYYAIQDEMRALDIAQPNIRDVFDMVVAIRSRKLPDPQKLGNSGSFFKNPVVDASTFERLRRLDPELKYFEVNNAFKIPAGYLIEQCGWKGKRVGRTGCYDKQALVVVNYGGATSSEVVDFIRQLKHSVQQTYGIELTPEVNIISN